MNKVFRINDVDFSRYVDKYGYSVTQTPVYSAAVTTLDGVEHKTVTRWKSALTVAIKPLTRAMAMDLYEAILDPTISVQYYNPQSGLVTQSMRVESVPYSLSLVVGDNEYYAETILTFIQN